MERYRVKLWLLVGVCLFITAVSLAIHHLFLVTQRLKGGISVMQLAAVLAGILALSALLNLATCGILARKKKPVCEGAMVGRLYWILAIVAMLAASLYGFGVLKEAGTLFTLFGGLVLGWSLQAPVSGFVAWMLVSLKRPYRPGDRVQFPKLELTGDIKDIGAMYLQLNQVGGSIASEEAVGRNILIPNAMLFDQVVINYTAAREAPYMLDEVVIGITYDSNWEKAEKILLSAAYEATAETIEATGVQPYIRSELYDYGVYLQLRYQVRVKDRAKIAYKITKLIFEGIQRTPSVDVAIPYIYSYRVGHRGKAHEEITRERLSQIVNEVDISRIHDDGDGDSRDVEQLGTSIDKDGLMRPIVLEEKPGADSYRILAGRSRFRACRNLGWKTIPAMVIKVPENGDYDIVK
jgi:small-conductance mechanosensitive channel